jgi:FAD/FMN-containing dehydrogenase
MHQPIDLLGLEHSFSGRLLTDRDEMNPFLIDWRKIWRGAALAIAQPDTVEDVASLVRWCSERRVPIVPQGGNTGMSGGASPSPDGNSVVISLRRLDRIRAINLADNVIIVDAGCILQNVQSAAEQANRLFPLSLGAEGSCTIGGNLATNAGGIGVLHYGNARNLCLGIEVVTPNGEIWNGLRTLRKDNSGYDLRDLFIGSEGTLGVITGAVLRLFPRPTGYVTAIAAVSSPEKALSLLDRLVSDSQEKLTAFEIMSEDCLSLVLSQFKGLRRPLNGVAPWYVLLELSHFGQQDRGDNPLEIILASSIDCGELIDATLAYSEAQRASFWALRERISEAQGNLGQTIKHDVAVPVSQVPAFLRAAHSAVAARWPKVMFVTFGHLGDGNIHYNLSPGPELSDAELHAEKPAINKVVHDIAADLGGTISAEHGLGQLRHTEAARYKPAVEIAMMQTIKDALDPRGIMNPGKLLP